VVNPIKGNFGVNLLSSFVMETILVQLEKYSSDLAQKEVGNLYRYKFENYP
jgi:hypothetical protein